MKASRDCAKDERDCMNASRDYMNASRDYVNAKHDCLNAQRARLLLLSDKCFCFNSCRFLSLLKVHLDYGNPEKP